MKRYGLILLILLSLSCMISCRQEPTEEQRGVVEEKAEETYESTKAYLQKQKDEYQAKIEADLHKLNTRIQELEAEAGKSREEERAKLSESIAEMKKMAEDAHAKLNNIKSASAGEWEDLKSGMDTALGNLEKAIDQLRSRLQ